MAKMIILLVSVSLALFGASASTSFQCEFKTAKWGTLGIPYWCSVKNSINITSLDEARVDSISGTHQAAHNNYDVEAFDVYQKGQIHYFPRGLNKLFKNLKGIEIYNTGLKEVHQSDLKDFPKLINLLLWSNDLEIIEENLFEFNPNLDYIYLASNKIQHIDPNVFDKLTKLNTLALDSNPCINMRAFNPTAIQNLIKTARAQCTKSVFLNLDQTIKNIEINSENFKEKLENLEIEIKNSKFPNTFHRRLQDLKAAQMKTSDEERIIENNHKKIDRLESKLTKIGSKLEENEEKVHQNQKKIDENFNILTEKGENLSQKISSSDQKVIEMYEKVSKLSKDMSTTLKDIESANNQNFAAIMKFIEILDKKIEEKLSEIDDAQKKLMNKIHKIESESHDDKAKINQKLRAILRAV